MFAGESAQHAGSQWANASPDAAANNAARVLMCSQGVDNVEHRPCWLVAVMERKPLAHIHPQQALPSVERASLMHKELKNVVLVHS